MCTDVRDWAVMTSGACGKQRDWIGIGLGLEGEKAKERYGDGGRRGDRKLVGAGCGSSISKMLFPMIGNSPGSVEHGRRHDGRRRQTLMFET